MFDNQLRYTFRFFSRQKGYSVINILGLTLGLSACLVIYNIVSYEFSFEQAIPDRERIYRIGARLQENNGNGSLKEGFGKTIPAPAPDALRAEIPSIAALASYYHYKASATIYRDRANEAAPSRFEPSENTIITSKYYFNIFSYTWLAGSPSYSLASPYLVVLTETRAHEYFGDMPSSEYLNRVIVYDDSLHVRVSGIVKDYVGNTDFRYTDFISFSTISHSFLKSIYRIERNDQWHFNPRIPGVEAFVKLSKTADPEKSEKVFDNVLQRHIRTDSFLQLLKYSLVLQPLDDVHFNAAYDHDGTRKANRSALVGLAGAAIFILLLAIFNFINLSTAQALQQGKNTGIRRVLGASRFRLILRSLAATAILTSLAAITSLLLAKPLMFLFQNYIPEAIELHPFAPKTLLFVIGSIIATTLLAGMYPALNLVSTQNGPALNLENSGRFNLRRLLIVLQFTISLIFIISSLIAHRQLSYMRDADMGFNSNAVVTITDFDAPPQQMRLFAREANRLQGVMEAIVQGHAPAGAPNIEFPLQADNRSEEKMEVKFMNGDRNFIPFYKMRLLAGHSLSSGDSLREFVINDTYRKALGIRTPTDAIGHTLTWQGRTYPITGVVNDFHTGSLHDPIPALVIARLQELDNSIGLRISMDNHKTLSLVETLWKKFFPKKPFSYTFLDESIDQLYKSDERLAWMVNVCTGIAIFVSCIGLFGLILFTVERKKKEISIRKVVGAGVADIVFLLNKEFLILVGIAMIISSPIAFLGLRRWLQNFAYRVQIPWWIFPFAGLVILCISIFTISLRVIQAALISPTKNLRSE